MFAPGLKSGGEFFRGREIHLVMPLLFGCPSLGRVSTYPGVDQTRGRPVLAKLGARSALDRRLRTFGYMTCGIHPVRREPRAAVTCGDRQAAGPFQPDDDRPLCQPCAGSCARGNRSDFGSAGSSEAKKAVAVPFDRVSRWAKAKVA